MNQKLKRIRLKIKKNYMRNYYSITFQRDLKSFRMNIITQAFHF